MKSVLGVGPKLSYIKKRFPSPDRVGDLQGILNICLGAGSQSVETLPAVILPTSLYRSVPPFKVKIVFWSIVFYNTEIVLSSKVT